MDTRLRTENTHDKRQLLLSILSLMKKSFRVNIWSVYEQMLVQWFLEIVCLNWWKLLSFIPLLSGTFCVDQHDVFFYIF